MTQQQPRDLVQRDEDAWNAHDPDRRAALFAPDLEYRSVTLPEPLRGRAAFRDLAARYNGATVLTVLLGVLCMYVALLALNLVGALLLVDSGVLGQVLEHPVGFADYLVLGWLATSASMIGGAVGSGMESDEHFRAAAYGRRGDPE